MTQAECIAKLREALAWCPACHGAGGFPIYVAGTSTIIPMPEALSRGGRCGTCASVRGAIAFLSSSSEPPQPGEITDEMVEQALDKWFEDYGGFPKAVMTMNAEYHRNGMRAALQAALGAKP